tara:strand:+ start:547 stop:1236 length:690 start_codon:yes stop_codon:yes gene_type:complete
MNKVTIIIPTKNEEESLKVLLHEINNLYFKDIIYETIIVDANSTDGTHEIAKSYQCKIIIEKEKKGYGSAIIEGIKNSNSKYSVVLDGDGSKNPNYINDLYKAIEKSNDDFIFASRYGESSGSEDDTLLTHFGNRVFTNLGKLMFKIKINDILHTFFICKTNVFNNLKFEYNDFSFCAELPILIKRLKIPHSEIPTLERKRIAGKVKVNSFIDGFIILKSMINLFFKKK